MDYLQYDKYENIRSIYWNVLNLIINGLPSILSYQVKESESMKYKVLNLIINGLPSIPYQRDECRIYVRKKSFLYGSKI